MGSGVDCPTPEISLNARFPTPPAAEVVQFLTAVLPSVYHHPPPGRVERSEGRVEHRNQRVTRPGPKRADPPKGRVK